MDVTPARPLGPILCGSYARDQAGHVFAAFCESVVIANENVKIINKESRGLCQDESMSGDMMFFGWSVLFFIIIIEMKHVFLEGVRAMVALNFLASHAPRPAPGRVPPAAASPRWPPEAPPPGAGAELRGLPGWSRELPHCGFSSVSSL